MLHWQVLKLLSRISLEARVVVCSTILHLLMLISIFVVYQGSAHFNVTISGTMINPDVEIVFMPLHRSIPVAASSQLGRTGKQQSGLKGSASADKQVSSKSSTTSKKADEPGTTIVKIAQAKPKPKAKKESKKTDNKRKETPAKKEVASKSEDKKIAHEEPKIESKKIDNHQKEKTSEPKVDSNNLASASSIATDGTIDTVVYVGQEEMDSLQAQEYIQQELAQHWAPPAGMRSDLQAIVTLTIDFEGIIKQVDLTQASGNLLFDTAAKKAAAQITPARWTFGKKLAITFKP